MTKIFRADSKSVVGSGDAHRNHELETWTGQINQTYQVRTLNGPNRIESKRGFAIKFWPEKPKRVPGPLSRAKNGVDDFLFIIIFYLFIIYYIIFFFLELESD